MKYKTPCICKALVKSAFYLSIKVTQIIVVSNTKLMIVTVIVLFMTIWLNIIFNEYDEKYFLIFYEKLEGILICFPPIMSFSSESNQVHLERHPYRNQQLSSYRGEYPEWLRSTSGTVPHPAH